MSIYIIIGDKNNYKEELIADNDIEAGAKTIATINYHAKNFDKKFHQNNYIRLYRISDKKGKELKRKILIQKINLYSI